MKALLYLQNCKRYLDYGQMDGEKEQLDEAISELEALQQPKSCFRCKFNTPSITKKYRCNHCIRIAIDRYEAKEQ